MYASEWLMMTRATESVLNPSNDGMDRDVGFVTNLSLAAPAPTSFYRRSKNRRNNKRDERLMEKISMRRWARRARRRANDSAPEFPIWGFVSRIVHFSSARHNEPAAALSPGEIAGNQKSGGSGLTCSRNN